MRFHFLLKQSQLLMNLECIKKVIIYVLSFMSTLWRFLGYVNKSVKHLSYRTVIINFIISYAQKEGDHTSLSSSNVLGYASCYGIIINSISVTLKSISLYSKFYGHSYRKTWIYHIQVPTVTHLKYTRYFITEINNCYKGFVGFTMLLSDTKRKEN